MTTEAIIESGMTFGPYPAGQCFYIEKSACYEKVQEGVKMAEFLLLKKQQQGLTVWVIDLATFFWTPTSLSGPTLLKVPG